MTNYQILGADKLEKKECDCVKEIADHYEKKISKVIGEIALKIHPKKHSKGGKSAKYDIRIKLQTAKKIFDTQESDWDLHKAMHKVFKNIQSQIAHKLHPGEGKLHH